MFANRRLLIRPNFLSIHNRTHYDRLEPKSLNYPEYYKTSNTIVRAKVKTTDGIDAIVWSNSVHGKDVDVNDEKKSWEYVLSQVASNSSYGQIETSCPNVMSTLSMRYNLISGPKKPILKIELIAYQDVRRMDSFPSIIFIVLASGFLLVVDTITSGVYCAATLCGKIINYTVKTYNRYISQ